MLGFFSKLRIILSSFDVIGDKAQWKVLEGLHKKLKVRHSVATNKYCRLTRKSIEKPTKGVLGAMIFMRRV